MINSLLQHKDKIHPQFYLEKEGIEMAVEHGVITPEEGRLRQRQNSQDALLWLARNKAYRPGRKRKAHWLKNVASLVPRLDVFGMDENASSEEIEKLGSELTEQAEAPTDESA